MPLCLMDRLVDQCEELGIDGGAVEFEDLGPLLEALNAVPDPRGARGRRYPWIFLLAGTLLAVLCGAKSLAAVAQWIDDDPAGLLEGLGPGKGRRRMWVSTLSRAFSTMNADALDDALYGWLNTFVTVADADAAGPAFIRAYAVDGKAVRGACEKGGTAPRLLAALRHEEGIVAAQRQVGTKTTEITAFIPLLDTVDIAGVAVTADQLHTQRGHATYLTRRKAYFVFTVGGNHPKLLHALTSLPWDKRRVAHRTVDRGHGRIEKRTIKVYRAPRGLPFPDVTQVFQIERRFTDLDGNALSQHVEVGITSLPHTIANPAMIARLLRGHWNIEALHCIRDTTYAEDASQVRTGSTPRAMATFRNMAISLLKLTGWNNIAQATRHMTAYPHDAATLIGLTM